MQQVSTESNLPKIIIQNEEDAYQILQRAHNGELGPYSEIIFDGWPTLNIYLKGNKFHQSLTPTIMRGLLEFQKGIYQSFASAKYNHPTKRLSEAEKKDLEIRVNVSKGSSDLDINYNEIALKLVEQIGGRMDPVHVLITVVTIAVLYFGTSAFKTFLETRKDVRVKEISDETHRKSIEALSFAGEQETKRAQIIAELAASDHRIDNIARIASQAQNGIIKSMAGAEASSIEGIPMSPDIAESLTRHPKRKASEVRLDGIYRLVKIDWSDPLKLKIKAINTNNKLTIDAEVQDDSLTGQYKEALRAAEWSRSPVMLKINAKVYEDGDYKEAVVVSAQSVPKDQET